MKTVTFCGHSEISFETIRKITPVLYYEIENLIKNGAYTFLLGGYGDFDRLCGEMVKKLQKDFQ